MYDSESADADAAVEFVLHLHAQRVAERHA